MWKDKRMRWTATAVGISCALAAPGLYGWESHQFASEAEKLNAFQEVVRTHDLREPFKLQPICTNLKNDLRTGTNVTPIEPAIRADSEDDPKLATWRQCDGVPPERMQTDDPATGYSGLHLLGGPPYRTYRIELDGNKDNGPEDVVYHEVHRVGTGAGSTGYAWVDLPGCAVRGGVPVSSMWLHRNAPGRFYRINMIVRYRGEPLVFDLSANTTDPQVSNYYFRATSLGPDHRLVCAWRERVVNTLNKSTE